MKKLYHSIVAAFSTFSALPTPRIDWEGAQLGGTLAALPLVGVVIGAFGLLYGLLAKWCQLPVTLSAAVLTVLPIAVSGGIHVDGFADTADALASWGGPEKKREILKDPHAGAFAVIGVGCYLLLYFGLCSALSLKWDSLLLLGLTHVLGRTLGALAGTVLPAASENGMLSTLRSGAGAGTVRALAVWTALCLAATVVISPLAALLFAVALAAVFFFVRRIARRQFGGMSGDLAGFAISVTELALLLALVISERLVLVWS